MTIFFLILWGVCGSCLIHGVIRYQKVREEEGIYNWIIHDKIKTPSFLSTLKFRGQDKEKILHAFPDFLENYALLLYSGLNTAQGWIKSVLSLPPGYLRDRLLFTTYLIEGGKSLPQILLEVENRFNVERLKPIFLLIRESQNLGLSLAPLLRHQSQQLRQELMLVWEEKAQTISIKLLFPILIFFFPITFCLLLGPIVLQILQSGSFF